MRLNLHSHSTDKFKNEEKQSREFDTEHLLSKSSGYNSMDDDMEDISRLFNASITNETDLIGNAPSLLSEEEETVRHSATSIQPTQTANVSYNAFRQNIALSKPIFDPGNGLMVVGTQEPVHLLSGPQAEIGGHKIVVSRLINNSGSSKESDFGILKPTKAF